MQRSLDASAAFIASVSDGFDTICQAPHRWPKYLHGTRGSSFTASPSPVIYLDDPDMVKIVAVAHNKRKLGYWKRRL